MLPALMHAVSATACGLLSSLSGSTVNPGATKRDQCGNLRWQLMGATQARRAG